MEQVVMDGNNNTQEDEIDLRELFKVLLNFKKSILLTLLLTLIIAFYFLYFKTPMYVSNATIEVKSSGTQTMQGGEDIIGSAFTDFGKEKVDNEMEILKTFSINNHALKKLDFQIRYFVVNKFKKVEIYHDIPIAIKDLTVFNPKFNPNILWKMIKISPVEDGYTLEVQNSFKNKLSHLLLGKPLIELEGKKIYPYNKKIKTKYFEFLLEKKINTRQPVYVNIIGNNRQIYQTIVHHNLNVSQINPAAPLIMVSFKDNIPDRATTYVNTLLDSFIEQSVAEKSKKINRIINFITRQLSEIKRKLDISEEKLEQYRIKNQAIDPTLQAQNYIKEQSNIEIELSKNELKLELIKNLLQVIQENHNLDVIAPYLVELEDQSTLNLVTKLQEAKINEEGLKTQYSAKHPGLIAIRKQIIFINQQIILNLKNLKTAIFHRNNNLIKQKKSYDKHLESLPTQERTLINLKRNYEVSSQTYNYLLKKKSENEMMKVAILSDYRIVEHAYNNGIPISPKPLLLMIVAFILGLILGISQALFRNFLNDKIQTKEDITSLTTLPIYGILPMLKTNTIKLEVLKNPKSPFAESYRSLRTNLQFSHKEKQSNIILISSTISGEGKTTTAANLATIFQMANYRTIVINLDLRKPTLHHYFDADNTHGMSTYLSSKHSMSEIIKSTDYQNLDIITSGPIPPNPSELILSDKLDTLLESLKETYEYVIIDSAPLGLVSDTMHLMQYVDLSLIVVRENYSQKSFLTDLNTLVSKHKLSHIGLVVNAVRMSSSSYGNGYGYGYGYGYDKK